MSVKRPALVALLLLGSSVAALHAQTTGDGAAAPPFGAPAMPASPIAGFKPAGPADIRTAALAPAGSAPWVLDRPKLQDPAQAAPADAAAAIDLSALRYYAHENDLARVAAEIRLLRAKFPGWEPPADLFTEASGESEQALWDLFARHDLDGMKAAMDERRQRTPGWQPSGDLAAKLALAEAGDALVRASDAQDWGTVVDVAAANRGLMTCGHVDTLWRTAEALVRIDDAGHALDAYRYILASCPNSQERLATMQKARALLKAPEDVATLMRMERRGANGVGEFQSLRLDAIRQAIGAAAAGGPVPAPADLDQVAAAARMPGGTGDAELLGWYALSRKDFAQAETWFRAALDKGPSPKAAEGLVLALRDGGKRPEATALAQTYADLGPLNQKLMMEVMTAGLADAATPLTPAQQASLAAAIDAQKSADAAQSYGWSRFKANDLPGAETWFRKSAGWQPSEPAAIGLMLVARKLKHQEDYAAAVSQYRALFPRVAELDAVMRTPAARPARAAPHATRTAARGTTRTARGDGWDASATDIVNTFQNGKVDEALALMDQRRSRRAEPRGLTVVRGWALYKKGDWDQASRVFTDLDKQGLTMEAAEGLRQIQLGYTNPRYR